MSAQFEGIFDPLEVKARRLRNGNITQVTIEQPYDEDRFEDLVRLQFKRVKVLIVEEEPVDELDLDEPEEEETELFG